MKLLSGLLVLVAGSLAVTRVDRRWRARHQVCPTCGGTWFGALKVCTDCGARGREPDWTGPLPRVAAPPLPVPRTPVDGARSPAHDAVIPQAR